jgi:hypothetical protein
MDRVETWLAIVTVASFALGAYLYWKGQQPPPKRPGRMP